MMMSICQNRGTEPLSFHTVLVLFTSLNYVEVGCGPPVTAAPGPTSLEVGDRAESMCEEEGSRGPGAFVLSGVTVLCCLSSKISCFMYHVHFL